MEIRIEFTYKTPKGKKTTFSSEELQADQAILIAEDLEKTGRSKNLKFIDRSENTWTMKELKEFLKGIETEPHNVSVYFDGGFDLETRHSGLGCVIYYEQNGKSYRLRKNASVEQLETNNEAEYAALHLSLKELELLEVHHLPVKFIGDSQVIINQLKGEWACVEGELSKWADRVEEKLKKLGIDSEYELISRKENREADQLATQALSGITIESVIELPSNR
ncbi:reverse transcriptase-like protein [Bacillus sp. Marseille-Q3570]|uniref:reverse transcriptase-like protein n=1 Tax=Bacillus sp. Marseille-Q3570 TaxID=2963522 RepID=UPI0021B778CC|nr:reverse transcriptase-like protein [Bacillus sp. Marseille-Q3570]